jgi:hypothetical protein
MMINRKASRFLLAAISAFTLPTMAALADDIVVTKAPVLAAATTPGACTNISGFFLTDCPLTWYGVRLYGTIDTGVG